MKPMARAYRARLAHSRTPRRPTARLDCSTSCSSRGLHANLLPLPADGELLRLAHQPHGAALRAAARTLRVPEAPARAGGLRDGGPGPGRALREARARRVPGPGPVKAPPHLARPL